MFIRETDTEQESVQVEKTVSFHNGISEGVANFNEKFVPVPGFLILDGMSEDVRGRDGRQGLSLPPHRILLADEDSGTECQYQSWGPNQKENQPSPICSSRTDILTMYWLARSRENSLSMSLNDAI